MKSPDELRAELDALEGKNVTTDNHGTPEVKEGIFDFFLRNIDNEIRQRQEEEDRNMQVCTMCFFLQSKENAACELCGGSEWLVPSVAKNNDDHGAFIKMAARHTIEDLKIALRSGWAKTLERELVAKRLLTAREAQRLNQQAVEASAPAQQPASETVHTIPDLSAEQIDAYYAKKIAQVRAGTASE